jgi:hypothetical protein
VSVVRVALGLCTVQVGYAAQAVCARRSLDGVAVT